MRILKGLMAATIVLSPVAGYTAQHNDADFYYEQPLEGVYSQGWTVINTGWTEGAGIDVYVRGEGKSGRFVGVLSVNCDDPARSDWVALGGVIGPDYVPPEVISGIRQVAC